MSSYYNSKFARGQIISFVTVDGVQEINLFDPKITKAINQVRGYQTYSFSKSDKIVNISYVAYATTSLWWAILLYNGLLHPYEIKEGTVLKVPDLNELLANITPIVNNIGQIVTL